MLLPGQIARITTGGALPEGATAVVMVEDTLLVKSSEDGTREEIVEILAKVRKGEAIREIGSDIQVGQTVLKKGQVISAVGGEIGVLASIGVQKVYMNGSASPIGFGCDERRLSKIGKKYSHKANMYFFFDIY